MKAYKNNFMRITAVIAAVCVIGLSCKKTFTDPPPIGDSGIVANTTIAALKARYTTQGTIVPVTDDVVIGGVVSCDDKSGNFYQQISIQDATGGILLRLAGNNLYNNYPVGRQIFVKCKGLFLGDYGKMIQLGGGVDSSGGFKNVNLLAVNLQDQHIIKGALNQPLIPKIVTVPQLTTGLQDPYINTLIELQGFEFASGDLGKNYADDNLSGNRIIHACTNPNTNQITVRTSDFANFATIPVAQGNGDILGVYSIFNSTKQLTLRDTTDVRFYGPRCPTAAGGGSISLGTSPLVFNFDNIGTSGLAPGIYVKQDATSLDLGNEATVFNGNFNTPTAWNQTSLGFKNFASATGLTSTASSTTQNASTNRALGTRQTGTVGTGGDPGFAFAFLLANTTGKSNLQLQFKLQSLDAPATVGRTTTWKVDYGIGQSPTAFSTITTSPTSLTSVNGAFSNTTVTVNFGSALNNITQPIWIRIVTLSGTSGGGNRASTAIDDVTFTWN
jgi:hypothetical protein